MPDPLHHVTISAGDFAISLAFYDAALTALGLERSAEFADEEEDDADVEAAGWGRPGEEPVLWLVTGLRPTHAAHVSLAAADRAAVEAFHAAGLAGGGSSQGAPRRWALYRRGRFGAQLRDPDGNLVEAVAPE